MEAILALSAKEAAEARVSLVTLTPSANAESMAFVATFEILEAYSVAPAKIAEVATLFKSPPCKAAERPLATALPVEAAAVVPKPAAANIGVNAPPTAKVSSPFVPISIASPRPNFGIV